VEALQLSERVKLFQARNKSKGLLRYLESFVQYLKIRFKYNPDVYIIGFRGHEIYWFLRIFALRKQFVFDEMMSPYDSIINEKKTLREESLLAKIIFIVEKNILKNADFIITDTQHHITYLAEKFNISKNKIEAIPVGTNEESFPYSNPPDNIESTFKVLFYGTFLPLHGVGIILEVAKRLKKLPIKFIIIGGKGKSKELEEFRAFVSKEKLTNVKHLEWVDFKQLSRYISQADICLGGPFGDTGQSKRVITCKTYHFLSLGKPTLIGKIENMTELYGLKDERNCLICEQGSAQALTEKIEWAYQNQDQLEGISQEAKKLFIQNFSYPIIQKELENILLKLI
jgi:glycosyltransferase involved in cell wall biosynthesis